MEVWTLSHVATDYAYYMEHDLTTEEITEELLSQCPDLFSHLELARRQADRKLTEAREELRKNRIADGERHLVAMMAGVPLPLWAPHGERGFRREDSITDIYQVINPVPVQES